MHVALSYANEISDAPFTSFSERVNNIATYFNIDETEAYHLYKAADLLVREKFAEPLAQIASDLNRTPAPQPR